MTHRRTLALRAVWCLVVVMALLWVYLAVCAHLADVLRALWAGRE